DSTNTIAEAIAIKEGKIVAVGTAAEIEKLRGSSTEVIDLKDKTVVPGFIDGHSHFMGLGRSKLVNLGSPPMGEVRNIPDLVKKLKTFQRENNLAEDEWINGFGYDQDQLEELRHPTKEDLDTAFPNTPVSITNINGHMSVSNSYALKLSGIDENTPNPEGGAIERKKESNEPTGLLQEKAQGLLKRPKKENPTLEEQLELLKEQQTYYASHGITTAQDGHTSFSSLQLLQAAAERGELFIDIEALPSYHTLEQVLADPKYKFGTLTNHLKLAGTKLTADGSPQGKTAFFTKSYVTEVPGCSDELCAGFPNVTQDELNEMVNFTFENNIRPFVHCNGDATIDMYIAAIDHANRSLNTTSTDRRPVTIHSQFVREDQLDKYKELGIIPAMFTNHAFFWG